MKAIFTIRERVYNGGALLGAILYVRDGENILDTKVIDYVKDIEGVPLFQLHFTDGTVMNVRESDPLMWEVSSKKKFATGKVPRLRGKDVWGTEEIER